MQYVTHLQQSTVNVYLGKMRECDIIFKKLKNNIKTYVSLNNRFPDPILISVWLL